MDNKGYVKIYRKSMQNVIWPNLNDWRLAMTLILKANWEPTTWQSRSGEIVKIGRGELVTSLKSLKKYSGLTYREIRTSLEHLEKADFLTSKTTSHFRLIKVINYSKYQDVPKRNDKDLDKDSTKTRQTPDNDIRSLRSVRRGSSAAKAARTDPPPTGTKLPNGKPDTIENRIELADGRWDVEALPEFQKIFSKQEREAIVYRFDKAIEAKQVARENADPEGPPPLNKK